MTLTETAAKIAAIEAEMEQMERCLVLLAREREELKARLHTRFAEIAAFGARVPGGARA